VEPDKSKLCGSIDQLWGAENMVTAEMKIVNGLPNRWYVEQKLDEIKREAKALRYVLRAIDLAEGKSDRPRAAVGDRSKGK
jgi:hypothetical protein